MYNNSSRTIRTTRGALAVIWLCSFGGTMVGLTAAQAANPDPEAGRKIQFAIPAQSLSSALLQFSEASQVKVFFNADVVRNLKSEGLQGQFTPQAAVQQLLAGSGLVHRYTSTGSVTIEPQPAVDPMDKLMAEATEPVPRAAAADKPKKKESAEGSTTVLPEMTVTATPGQDTSYNVPNASTATKTDTPIMETPVSIQVIPQQVLKDQQVVRLQDALKNVSGVQFTPTSGNEADAFVIRGFVNEGDARFRDGKRFNLFFKSDLANIEQIEVLKGPAAVLYGRLEPGGIINLVTKKPLDQPYYALQQQFGSYDFYRTTVDATGPIDEAKTLLYRFNLGYTDTESFRDELFKEALFIAPSLTWRPTEATEINLSYEHREEDVFFDSGIPVQFADGNNRIPPISLSSQFTEPGVNDENDYDLVDLNASHRFHALDADWTARAGFQYVQTESKFPDISACCVQADGRTVDRFLFFINEARSSRNQAFLDFTGKFQLWGTEHTGLLGWDFYQDESASEFFFDGAGQFADQLPVDLFDPQFGRVDITAIQAQPSEFFSKFNQRWHGVYFQDQIALWDKLHLLGGGRYDWAETSSGRSSVSLDDVQEDTLREEEFSPRVGLVYQPWSWLSLYGNYVESFGASSGRSSTGSPLRPQGAEQYEAGLKTEFFGGRLSSTLAFYHLTKTNLPADDLSTPAPDDVIQIGEARSRGIEFDISGQLTDRLSVIGTYAFTDAKITKETVGGGFQGVGEPGDPLPGAPENSGSLWSKYQILPGRFEIGTGVFLVGRSPGVRGVTVDAPGYGRWDAFAAYHFKLWGSRLTAQVNVNNILDKEYFNATNILGGGVLFPGEPLSVLGSIRVEY